MAIDDGGTHASQTVSSGQEAQTIKAGSETQSTKLTPVR